MVMLVSLQQASDHLRRDTTDDDNDLTLKIKAASAAIMAYLGGDIVPLLSTGEPEEDSNGIAIDVPDQVMQATLIVIGMLYADRDAPDFRDGGTDDRLGKISLPKTVHWLLDPLRTPRLA